MREIKNLEELKRIELDIMKHIHSFCQDNNIPYCLTYGTLIGAVRHKGFIPWDDDIDIFMLREDYERFRRIFPEYGKEHNLYIVASDTKPCLPRAMAKVCDARTLLIEPKYKGSDDIGVFVDIWPLDGAPIEEKKRRNFFKLMQTCHRLFYAGIEKTEYYTGKGIGKRVARFICNIIGPLNIEKFIERKAIKYPVEPDGHVESYADGVRDFMYSDIFPCHLAPFEDSEFYIPDNYDSCLRKVYGDYMKLPPEAQRVPHHVINTYWIEEGETKQ